MATIILVFILTFFGSELFTNIFALWLALLGPLLVFVDLRVVNKFFPLTLHMLFLDTVWASFSFFDVGNNRFGISLNLYYKYTVVYWANSPCFERGLKGKWWKGSSSLIFACIKKYKETKSYNVAQCIAVHCQPLVL